MDDLLFSYSWGIPDCKITHPFWPFIEKIFRSYSCIFICTSISTYGECIQDG